MGMTCFGGIIGKKLSKKDNYPYCAKFRIIMNKEEKIITRGNVIIINQKRPQIK